MAHGERRWECLKSGEVYRFPVEGGCLYRIGTGDGWQVVFAPASTMLRVVYREEDNDAAADDTFYLVLETKNWWGDEMPGEWITYSNLWEYIKQGDCDVVVGGVDPTTINPRPRDRAQQRMGMAEAGSAQMTEAQAAGVKIDAETSNSEDEEGEGRGDTALVHADADRGNEQSVR